MASHLQPWQSPMAPTYPLPSTSLALVEYPGPVASTSASQSRAIHTLGGPARLSKALQSDNGVVELNFRPDVPFSHSVGGDTLQAGNMVLIKVTKRRRRKMGKTRIEGDRLVPEIGVYKVEAVGVVDKLIRFRSMADLQYQPPNIETDETIKLATALWNMDVHAMQRYRFPEPSEDFDNDLRLLPPPVFSRLTLPQTYAYRANPLSIPVTITKEDGTEITRLVNKGKYKGEFQTTIPFSAPASEVPTGPGKYVMQPNDTRPGLEPATVEKITKLLEERPVWSKTGLVHNLTKHERSRTQNLKLTLPYLTWTFSDGPFRDCAIRFGYDPRTDPEARFYQRIAIRNMANTRAYLKKIPGGVNNTELVEAESDHDTHIFNGETVRRNVGSYQLCDLTDPYLHELLQSTEFVHDTCDFRDGWWDSEFIEYIRRILKRKYLALYNNGIKLSNDTFDDLHEHLDEYRAQRDLDVSRQRESVVGDDMVVDAENAEAEDQFGIAGQKRLTSLRRKAARNQRPRAKMVGDGLARQHTSLVSKPGHEDITAHSDDEEQEADVTMDEREELAASS